MSLEVKTAGEIVFATITRLDTLPLELDLEKKRERWVSEASLKREIEKMLQSVNYEIRAEETHREANYPMFQNASKMEERFEKGRKTALEWILGLLVQQDGGKEAPTK